MNQFNPPPVHKQMQLPIVLVVVLAWQLTKRCTARRLNAQNATHIVIYQKMAKEVRQPSVVIENKDVSPFGAFTQSGLQPFAGKSSAVSVPKGSAANRPRKKKSSFNWIAVIAVPTGVICGICLATVLLWVVFKKDPLGIMVADTNVQQPNRSASTPIKPTDKKAPLVPNVNSNGGSASDSSELKQGTEPSPPPAVAPFDAVKAKEHQNSWMHEIPNRSV